MLANTLAPLGVYEGMSRVWLYLALIPGTAPFVWAVSRLPFVGRSRIALGYSWATAVAMLFDGVALAWFPGLYGTEVAHTAGAGAIILWGAGVGIVLAVLWNRNEG